MRTIIDAQKLLDLAKRGMTAAQIARDMDIPIGTVCSYATRTNIELTKGKRGGNTRKHVQPDHTTGIGIVPENASLTDEHAADEAARISEVVKASEQKSSPCLTLPKPTPVQALADRIRLPWFGKVQQQTPADLAPDLYDELLAYGNFEQDDLSQVFGFTSAGFQVWLKKYGYPVRASEPPPVVEHDLTIKPRPGQTFAGREKEMAAKRAVSYEKLKTAVADNEIRLDTASPVIFRTHDFAADTFTPEDDAPIPYTFDLRDCAARLLDAIDARDAAIGEVKKYQDLIRRLA